MFRAVARYNQTKLINHRLADPMVSSTQLILRRRNRKARKHSENTRQTGFNPLTAAGDLWRNTLIDTLPADMSITRLVRNLLNPAAGGGDENTVRSNEIALIAEINRRYSPEEVLEWHLNTEYFGNEAYGIEAAAQIYLGKSVLT